jgi:hypothetical protein
MISHYIESPLLVDFPLPRLMTPEGTPFSVQPTHLPFGPRHQSRSLDATAAECHLHSAQFRPEQRIGGFAQLHGGALVHTLNGDLVI